MFGLTITNSNGDWHKYASIIGTYILIFIINLAYDIVTSGGIASITWLTFGDSALRALLLALMLFAGEYGIRWKQGQE